MLAFGARFLTCTHLFVISRSPVQSRVSAPSPPAGGTPGARICAASPPQRAARTSIAPTSMRQNLTRLAAGVAARAWRSVSCSDTRRPAPLSPQVGQAARHAFVADAARRISTVGGSLRDVHLLAGHAALTTTQRYIEADAEARRRVVELV